jgi:hypothetical protein
MRGLGIVVGLLLLGAGSNLGGCGGTEKPDGDGDADGDSDIVGITPDGEFFTPDNSIFTGVVIENDRITLSAEAVVSEIIWLTNSLEGSISKINTATHQEEGRYYTGPSLETANLPVDPKTGECPPGSELDEAGTACLSADYHSDSLWGGPGQNPSRTSVDPFGNAFVANRAFSGIPSVTKINHRCQARENELVTWVPDGDADLTNNPPPLQFRVDDNGTPSPFDDTFEWDDDCIVWHLRGQIEALDRMAGDVPANDTSRTNLALGRGVVIQQREGTDGLFHTYGWLSIHYMRQYYEFDGESGELTGRVIQFPGCTPYGAAIDRFGILWSACLSGVMGRADTDPALVAEGPVDGTPDPVVVGTAGHCLDSAGNEVEGITCIYGEDIAVPSASYGITVGPAIHEGDPPVRVYAAQNGITEYTPEWTNDVGVVIPAASIHFQTGNAMGIGVDREGIVWSNSDGGMVARVNPYKVTDGVIDIDAITTIPTGRSGRGIGIATDGMIWAVNWSHYDSVTALTNDGNVTLIDPHPAADDDGDGDPDGVLPDAYLAETCCEEISNSYTYSDVTGFQLSASMAPLGEFRFFIPPCEGGATTWGDITVGGDFPDGTSLLVQAKIVEDIDDLQLEDGWVTLLLDDGADRIDGEHPTGGTFVMPELEGEGALGMRVTLTTDDQSRTVRPAVDSVDIGRVCP